MSRISKRHKWVVPFLTVLLLSLLAGADVECDFEDGEFEFDLPGFGHRHDDCWSGGFYCDEYYYEEYYYEPAGWWSWW